MHSAEVEQRHLAGRAGALGGVDHERVRAVLGEGGAQALEQHAAEGDVRVRDHRHEAQARARRTCGAGRRPGRCGCCRVVRCGRSWRGSARSVEGSRGSCGSAAAALLPLRRGEDQVHVARRRAPGGAAAAAQRALHQRVGRQAVPVFGHALAVGDADDLQLVADQRVERRAELDGLVDLATARCRRSSRPCRRRARPRSSRPATRR